MKEISFDQIVQATKEAVMSIAYDLPMDVQNKLEEMRGKEDGDIAKHMLDVIIENAKLSRDEFRPMCQDTGMAVCFVTLGQDVHITGGAIEDAINEGVRQGYEDGYLRKSVVKDPVFDRSNTQDNTPAVIHYKVVPGDQLTLEFGAKGFGSENMSQLKMFPPSAGLEGAKEFVLKVVSEAGPNACPPLIVGVGLGGTFEKAALLAKEAALRSVDKVNPDPNLAALEEELLEKVNDLGVGPQGFGGKTTALKVNVNVYPTHIAGLPVAVNINCHAARHIKVEL